MKNGTWKIVAVDKKNETMVVQFDHTSGKIDLNLVIPREDVNLEQYIEMHAPTSTWVQKQTPIMAVTVGMQGDLAIHEATEVKSESESVNAVGSWSDEYLRAMIYQVFEEIKESTV